MQKDNFNIFEKSILFNVSYTTWHQVVRDIRKLHKITQLQLGQEFGYSPQQISRFESGDVEPPIDFWNKFTKKFKVNLEWVVFGVGEVNKTPPSDPSVLRNIPTKDLENTLKERKHVIEGFRHKAIKIRNQILADERRPPGYKNLIQETKRATNEIIPHDAPDWLREDLKDVYLAEEK